MPESGLNDLYQRGYTVLLDRTGMARRLPAAMRAPAAAPLPDQATLTRLESEFWFEATQVAVYLLRRDLWVAKMREHTMHTCLLAMLEWRAQSDPDTAHFTWHIGHHLDEWLAADDYATAGQVSTHFDPIDTLRGMSAAMDLFARATAQAAGQLGLKHRPDLVESARSHVYRLLGDPRR